MTHACFLFQEIRAVGAELGITPVIIRGEELKQKGFGGTVPADVYIKLTHLSLIFHVCQYHCHIKCFISFAKINMHLKLHVSLIIYLGIYGVGKAAEHPPALAVLSHKPDGATQTIAWVGKGIVYDTGGLSIKGKVHPTLT